MIAEDAVNEVLGHLHWREQDFVRLRLGLYDGRVRTLDEVGNEFGLSRERAFQVQSKIIWKCRQLGAADLCDDLEDS